MRTHEDVDNLFSYHRLDADGVLRSNHYREKFKALAHEIINTEQESPERTLVLRTLHTTFMQLNVLISLGYPVEKMF